MKKKKETSFYDQLGERLEAGIRHDQAAEKINFPETLRRIRMEKKLSGVELCRRAGDLDPRTLTALEKGRIKNPSIRTLQSLSRGLGVTVSDLFRQSEVELTRNMNVGSQKGFYHIDFPAWGVKMVSFTPFIRDFFCGKMLLGAHKKLDQTLLRHPQPVYISVLMGKCEVTIEEKKVLLKEGENLFFNGILRHTFTNPLEREAALLLVTAPSFV